MTGRHPQTKAGYRPHLEVSGLSIWNYALFVSRVCEIEVKKLGRRMRGLMIMMIIEDAKNNF